ncbi:MAG: sigma-70 family RNA polymerase sigma factor [Acidobacteriota bacterium]|nr:sigma-70 family RNA polymerase sigma factor [Acidobacteriota bacterium]
MTQPVSNAPTARSGTDADPDFEAVFLDHYARVLGLLTRLVGERSQAEELVNEVFWKLSRQPGTLLTDNVGGWLYRTATHAGLDALRSSARRRRYEESAARRSENSESGGPLDDVLRQEDRGRVQVVLISMKPAQAQILLMRASGASYKELANALGVAAGGIGTLLNRAEAEFRKRYIQITGKKEKL